MIRIGKSAPSNSAFCCDPRSQTDYRDNMFLVNVRLGNAGVMSLQSAMAPETTMRYRSNCEIQQGRSR